MPLSLQRLPDGFVSLNDKQQHFVSLVIHPFNMYLWRASQVLDTILGTGYTMVNETGNVLDPGL